METTDVLAAMQGNEYGHGKGLTTYPGGDREQRAAHAACLELERDGKITRHHDNDGSTHPSGVPFVIWLPVEAPQAP
jgi:hypothetical protein